MEQRDGLGKKAAKGLASWAGEKAIENWKAILLILVPGGGMAALAAFSNWLAAYGPVSYGAIGIFTSFLMAIAYVLYGIGARHLAQKNYLEAKTTSKEVNVLAKIFQSLKINLSDFYHPFYAFTENARFEDCHLMGPINLSVQGGTHNACGYVDCEIVIVRADRRVTGITAFKHAFFINCRFYRVTFMMNVQEYQALPDAMKMGIKVVSDGRVGDL